MTTERDEAVRVLERLRDHVAEWMRPDDEAIPALDLAIAALRDGEVKRYGDVRGTYADESNAYTPPAQQPEAQAVVVETVGFVRTDRHGDLCIDWTLEGGISALEVGEELIIASTKITDDDGGGEVFTHPTTPAVGGDSFGGMKVVRDPNVPEGQVHAVQGGKVVGIVTPAAEPSSEGVREPDVIGADQSPIPAADTRSRWHLRYIDTMVRAGVPAEAAVMCCEGGYDDHDYTTDPEEAARDEMSYWDDDGDEAALATKPAKGGEE